MFNCASLKEGDQSLQGDWNQKSLSSRSTYTSTSQIIAILNWKKNCTKIRYIKEFIQINDDDYGEYDFWHMYVWKMFWSEHFKLFDDKFVECA